VRFYPRIDRVGSRLDLIFCGLALKSIGNKLQVRFGGTLGQTPPPASWVLADPFSSIPRTASPWSRPRPSAGQETVLHQAFFKIRCGPLGNGLTQDALRPPEAAHTEAPQGIDAGARGGSTCTLGGAQDTG
jgi:hypothetical protein